MFDIIVQILTLTGVAGVALMMFAENLFPPIPSKLIIFWRPIPREARRPVFNARRRDRC
ncbi:hypothetical protein [Brevundimonas sp.]|jgi:hypothetical protein|uniref:hypothetical protein n=1 Tax=Brevundimonas sp. TaxID=1871086 RepID=UPI0037C072D5